MYFLVSTVHKCLALGLACLKCNNSYKSYSELLGSCHVYILTHSPDMPEDKWILVVPTSIQMGWIKSPEFFCTVPETSRDIIDVYTNTPLGELLELLQLISKLDGYPILAAR